MDADQHFRQKNCERGVISLLYRVLKFQLVRHLIEPQRFFDNFLYSCGVGEKGEVVYPSETFYVCFWTPISLSKITPLAGL